MEIAPALLEFWLRDYYFETSIDLGCSGVEAYSLGELRKLLNLTEADLDQVDFRDGRSLGDPELRKAIARRWGNGDHDRVMVTHGSSEAIYLIMRALLQGGDEVVVLDPSYQSLFSIAGSIGCKLKSWEVSFGRQFVPDLDQLKHLIGPRTKMVIVNFPHNPTGASLSLEQQKQLIDLVEEAGAYLFWDGAFAELVYEGTPLPDPTTRYHRTISTGTLSKAFGLPGLRVGWCLASPEILDRCVQLRDYITLSLSPLIELIARMAIEKIDDLLRPRMLQARLNLEALAEWIDRHQDHVEWVRPKGGVSAFLRLRGIEDTDAFCHDLMRRHSVLLVPGTCFNHQGFVRLGFGGPTAEFKVGLTRLSSLLKSVEAPQDAE
jgi:capreomycidine synthase